MHILPLPLCGLYSIRAQNGYEQHRPCKIVLLTLVAPRGVTDLHLSSGIHKEHARTAYAYHETCWTEYQQLYRSCNSPTQHHKWNITQARPMSVSDISRSLQSWVSTTYRSYSQLTFFNLLQKNVWTIDFGGYLEVGVLRRIDAGRLFNNWKMSRQLTSENGHWLKLSAPLILQTVYKLELSEHFFFVLRVLSIKVDAN